MNNKLPFTAMIGYTFNNLQKDFQSVKEFRDFYKEECGEGIHDSQWAVLIDAKTGNVVSVISGKE